MSEYEGKYDRRLLAKCRALEERINALESAMRTALERSPLVIIGAWVLGFVVGRVM